MLLEDSEIEIVKAEEIKKESGVIVCKWDIEEDPFVEMMLDFMSAEENP